MSPLWSGRGELSGKAGYRFFVQHMPKRGVDCHFWREIQVASGKASSRTVNSCPDPPFNPPSPGWLRSPIPIDDVVLPTIFTVLIHQLFSLTIRENGCAGFQIFSEFPWFRVKNTKKLSPCRKIKSLYFYGKWFSKCWSGMKCVVGKRFFRQGRSNRLWSPHRDNHILRRIFIADLCDFNDMRAALCWCGETIPSGGSIPDIHPIDIYRTCRWWRPDYKGSCARGYHPRGCFRGERWERRGRCRRQTRCLSRGFRKRAC